MIILRLFKVRGVGTQEARTSVVVAVTDDEREERAAVLLATWAEAVNIFEEVIKESVFTISRTARSSGNLMIN